jgi:hypothetical protein
MYCTAVFETAIGVRAVVVTTGSLVVVGTAVVYPLTVAEGVAVSAGTVAVGEPPLLAGVSIWTIIGVTSVVVRLVIMLPPKSRAATAMTPTARPNMPPNKIVIDVRDMVQSPEK